MPRQPRYEAISTLGRSQAGCGNSFILKRLSHRSTRPLSRIDIFVLSLLRREGRSRAFEIWLEYVNLGVEATIKDVGASGRYPQWALLITISILLEPTGTGLPE